MAFGAAAACHQSKTWALAALLQWAAVSVTVATAVAVLVAAAAVASLVVVWLIERLGVLQTLLLAWLPAPEAYCRYQPGGMYQRFQCLAEES